MSSGVWVWPTFSWRAEKESEVRLITHLDSFPNRLCSSTKILPSLEVAYSSWFFLFLGSGNLSLPHPFEVTTALMLVTWVPAILCSRNPVCLFEDKPWSSRSPGLDRFFHAKSLPGIPSFTLFLTFVDSFLSCLLSNSLNMVVVMYNLAFVVIVLGASLGYLINTLGFY